MSRLIAVVMAAGHGTRMKSETPKVLHRAAGRRLLDYPVRSALEAGADEVVVVANRNTRAQITAALADSFGEGKVVVAEQAVPRGTGDAARAGLAAVPTQAEDHVLILNGDVPLVEEGRLQEMLAQLDDSVRLCFLSFEADDPHGYGRVLRDSSDRVREIREQKDLRSDQERAVGEVNGGIYAGRAHELADALGAISSDNAQGEFYITDIVEHIARGSSVVALRSSGEELSGVNDRVQLAEVETILFERVRRRLRAQGVTIVGHPLIDDTTTVEGDAHIEDGVRLRGTTSVGKKTVIDVGSVITDAIIGEEVHIKPYCVVSSSRVGHRVQLGPFAHLRPDSVLEEDAHVGNFVETKKTTVRRGAKANHLAYLGDAEIGEKSNLGAGTIICNYDGFRKQRTTIGREVFVGSDTQIVAPVTIGDGAYVATGTTVTDDVPEDGFAIGRSRQTTKKNYAKILKERLFRAKKTELESASAKK